MDAQALNFTQVLPISKPDFFMNVCSSARTAHPQLSQSSKCSPYAPMIIDLVVEGSTFHQPTVCLATGCALVRRCS